MQHKSIIWALAIIFIQQFLNTFSKLRLEYSTLLAAQELSKAFYSPAVVVHFYLVSTYLTNHFLLRVFLNFFLNLCEFPHWQNKNATSQKVAVRLNWDKVLEFLLTTGAWQVFNNDNDIITIVTECLLIFENSN